MTRHTQANGPESPRPALRGEDGYSLLEILIALAIIAVIATLVGPRLFGQLDRAKVTAAKAQIQMLETSLDTMRLDLGRYPSAEEGLSLLVAPPSEEAARQRWFGPYIDGELPLDPWDRPYLYAAPRLSGQRAAVYSYGADGEEGGTGLDADLGHVEAH